MQIFVKQQEGFLELWMTMSVRHSSFFIQDPTYPKFVIHQAGLHQPIVWGLSQVLPHHHHEEPREIDHAIAICFDALQLSFGWGLAEGWYDISKLFGRNYAITICRTMYEFHVLVYYS
jgi:hypothetical protein